MMPAKKESMSDTKVTLTKNPFSSLPGALTVIEDPKLPPHEFVLRTENHEVLVDAKNGTVHKRRRVKFEPVPDYGTLMTWADFCEGVASGGLEDDDGSGDLATATERSNVSISPATVYDRLQRIDADNLDVAAQKLKPPHEWATHVHWCNK